MNLKKINLATLQRFTSPQAIKDLDKFLDDIPVNVGYNALIAAVAAWVIAGAAIFFTSMEMKAVNKIHAELMEVEALQPPVPVLKYVPVKKDNLKALCDRIAETYKGITLGVTDDGVVTVAGKDTDYFPQFLAAISSLQRGGKNWRVQISTLCAGRACASQKLAATLAVDMVRLGEAEKKPDKEENKKAS